MIEETRAGPVIRVRAKPGARRDEIAVGPDALRVAVSAPPEAGKANAALIKLLARALRVPQSAIEVVSGSTARDKRLLVRGLTATEVRARLGSPRA